MAIHEFEPTKSALPQSGEILVWQEEFENNHPNFQPTQKKLFEQYVKINSQYLGELDMVSSADGQIANILGIIPEPGSEDVLLTEEQWDQVVTLAYMRGITRARRIIHPEGQKLFLEAL